jgi:hypothetical protein
VSKARVMVEVDGGGCPIRIFRAAKQAFALPPERVKEYPRAEAVARIRHAIFVRCGGRCEYGCGRAIVEDKYQPGARWPNIMEMHEEIPRGSVHKVGEISLQNSYAVCGVCHRKDARGHLNRRLHWGETRGEENGRQQ